MMVMCEKIVVIADATASARPDASAMADIAEQAAEAVRHLGHTPRLAFLSFSNFGKPMITSTENIHKAVTILDDRGVKVEYEGEMAADVALNFELQKSLYSVSRLIGPANILIMPGLHSANISYKMLAELGGGSIIWPMTWGLEKSMQITRMGSSTSDIINMAGLDAMGAIIQEEEDGQVGLVN